MSKLLHVQSKTVTVNYKGRIQKLQSTDNLTESGKHDEMIGLEMTPRVGGKYTSLRGDGRPTTMTVTR